MLNQLADELLELKRYVRSKPEHVKRELPGLIRRIYILCQPYRLQENIQIGLQFIVQNPAMLEGYLYGAAYELRAAAHRVEREVEE
jgi:hypothetical protein